MLRGRPVPPRLAALRRMMQVVGADVPGTDARRGQMRQEIVGYEIEFAMPSAFFTCNPADSYSLVSLHFQGIRFDFEHEFPELPSLGARAQQVLSHPVQRAEFFHFFMEKFMQHVMGCDARGPLHGTGTISSVSGGVAGFVVAYYGPIEYSRGGKAHTHMHLWLAGTPGPDELRQWMRNLQPG